MDRFQRLINVSLFLALLACGLSRAATPPATSPDDPHQALRSVADAYWEFYLRQNPELATEIGDARYNNRLTDYSLARFEKTRDEATGLLLRARSLDVRRRLGPVHSGYPSG